jgi:AcrR family transcriptional regulator
MRTLNPAVHDRQSKRILDTACTLFARWGYRETSMDAIAAACRLRKPSLYHYFKSKQALLRTLIQRRLLETHRLSLTQPHQVGSDLEIFFFQWGMAFLESSKVRRTRDFMLLLHRNSFNDAFVRRTFNAALQENLQDMLHSSRQNLEKVIGAYSPDMAIHQFMGCLVRYTMEIRLWKSPLALRFDETDYIRGLARIFAHGLSAVSDASPAEVRP